MNSHSQNKFPPGPKGRIPLLRLGKFVSKLPNTLLELAQHYGDIVHFQFSGRHIYLLNHPDFIYEVLVRQQQSFVKGRVIQHTRQLLGESLLTDESQPHLEQRRILQPIFHKQALGQFDQVIVSATRKMSKTWRDNPAGQPIDLAAEMSGLTMGIVAEFIFSTPLSQQSSQLRRDIKILLNQFESIVSTAVTQLRPRNYWRTQQAKARLDKFMADNIAERKEENVKSDVLSFLIQGNRVSDQQLRDHLMTLFITGYETSASALSWTFYLLSQNPIITMTLKQELDSVLGGRSAQAGDFDPLVYTRMVFNESLRLYPPAWIIGREATADVNLGGYTIPSGSTVLLSQWVTHHDPRYYPHPFSFRPERWTPEVRAQRPKMAFFPFGAGQRQCIGEQLAWLIGVLTVATILQDWYFQPIPGRSMKPHFALTLRPRKGAVVIPVALEKDLPAASIDR